MLSSAARFDLVNEIMADALDYPAERRDEYVAAVCGGDAAMCAEVTRLIRLYEASGDLLDDPPVRRGSLAPGDVVAGRYAINAELGRGGMGAVYEVEDLETGRVGALKTLIGEMRYDPDAIARLRAEFTAARAVSHPNVCPVFDFMETEGAAAFTMARLDGETLAERIARGPLPADRALEIARGIAAGLDALHAAGIVHRDLKPSNIAFVGREPVIVDFGLASSPTASPSAGQETRRIPIEGSPDYMAPEQFRGSAAAASTDIYAFGLILFEMVSGRRPFPDEDPIPAAVRRATEDAPPVSAFGGPAEWDDAIARALRREPAARTASAVEVVWDLDRALLAAAMKTVTPRGETVKRSTPNRSPNH